MCPQTHSPTIRCLFAALIVGIGASEAAAFFLLGSVPIRGLLDGIKDLHDPELAMRHFDQAWTWGGLELQKRLKPASM